jgi:hypothetical protein
MNRANRPRMSRISGSSRASKLMTRAGDGSTLFIDFTTGVLDPRITFSRADATARATFVNNLGYVTTVSSAQDPRFDYDLTSGVAKGLLIETTATNLVIQGQDCWGGGAWGRSGGVNINAVSGSGGTTVPRINGPDNGTLTGTSISKDATYTFVRLNNSATVSASTQYTYSMYVRAGTGGTTYFRLAPFNGGSALTTVGACSDPAVGIDNASSFGTRFYNLPTDRWVRVWVTFTTAAGQTSLTYTVYPNLDTSAASINYIWGAQVELGPIPSSVILTAASSVTRATDTAIIAAGSNFSSWYTGGTTGTFVANWYANAASSTARSVIATNDQTTKHLHMYQTASALTLRLADFGAAATVTTGNSMTAGALTKGAFSYASTATNLCLNGGTVASGTLAFSSAPTWLSIGGPSTNGTSITDATVMLNNSIRSIKYWPTVLPNTTLQSLTT